MINTPVLFIIFNRMDTTEKVFAEIRNAKPLKLFIASDAGRNEQEAKRVTEVRKYVLGNIDWECELKTNFRDKNAGCKINVSEAISWFFEHVEEGIILEDDCLPNHDFFRFCTEMLEKYRDDERIGQISGTCLLRHDFHLKESYHFSNSALIWGWATWKRAWKNYDPNMKCLEFLKKHKIINTFNHNILSRLRFKWTLSQMKRGNIDTWDYQWTFSCLAQNQLTIVPNNNLISNIGFQSGGTNIKNIKSKKANMALKNLPETLIHPDYIAPYYDLYKRFSWEDEIDILTNVFTRTLMKPFKK